MTHWPNSDSSLCQIGIIGVYDGTLVDITFPTNPGHGTVAVEYGGTTYTNGDTLSLPVNRFSTLQLQSKGKNISQSMTLRQILHNKDTESVSINPIKSNLLEP